MKKQKKLAIFDIDGTVYRWSLFIEIVVEFIRVDIFPKRAYDELLASYLLWLERKIHYYTYLETVIKIYYTHLKGCREEEVKKIAGAVLSRKKDRVYRFTKHLIEKLKKEGHYLLAISGSPSYIVADFAKYFGFDAYYGVVYEVKDGKFTGRMLDSDPAMDKKNALTRLLKEHVGEFDLKNSVAVGDTESDIPLLSAVGRPIAFNPNKDLVAYARKMEWRIVVERKDVIFDVVKFSIIKL